MKSVLGVHWKDWHWSWNSSTLATSCEELTHWKRFWCWEGLGAGGEGDDRGWDGWMASLTRWTWVWVSSGSWWWTGRPGMLWFMGSQSWTWLSDWTEQNWYWNILNHCSYWNLTLFLSIYVRWLYFFKVLMIFLENVKGLDLSEYANYWSILCWRIVQQAEFAYDPNIMILGPLLFCNLEVH